MQKQNHLKIPAKAAWAPSRTARGTRSDGGDWGRRRALKAKKAAGTRVQCARTCNARKSPICNRTPPHKTQPQPQPHMPKHSHMHTILVRTPCVTCRRTWSNQKCAGTGTINTHCRSRAPSQGQSCIGLPRAENTRPEGSSDISAQCRSEVHEQRQSESHQGTAPQSLKKVKLAPARTRPCPQNW